MTPLLHNRSKDRGIADTTTIWVESGHKIRVSTHSYEAFYERPSYMSARSEHFHDGRWQEVLPPHTVPYVEETDELAYHRVILASTIDFLGA